MKHFMQPKNPILREMHSADLPSSPSPSSAKPRPSRKTISAKENALPPDPNFIQCDSKQSPANFKSPLPPRPPSSNPLKRKLIMETVPENSVPVASDSGVKVIVRMRPPHKDRDEGDVIVQKTSSESLSINGQTFTFDSVADIEATQQDIFQLVGAPLVENCLAGFNSSVFAYGQTGSGKTYTMWGPANALLQENLSSDQQGLTPRVFEQLFARIIEEQIKHADKQLEYQCYCSFLEIYNEQITDLLDPNQRNLQVREDVKSGVYVENLKEESVRTMKDVTLLLIKGLSNRRTGATSINAESSRSHTVFTCVVESRCKSKADALSSFKTSRINLVDLAGSERQKLTGASGERLKEAGNINRSLSQLGNLINILAEVSQTGKQRHIPYRDSRLTFLLQESLGGNSKLAMVCAVSPSQCAEALNDFSNGLVNCVSPPSLSILPSDVSPVLKSPIQSVSPRICDSRKSLRTSSMLTASQKDPQDDKKLGPEAAHIFKKSMRSNTLSAEKIKNFISSTEHLAASIHNGLEIIDSHRQSSALRQSSFRFSSKPTESKPVLPVEKVDMGVQTSLGDTLEEDSVVFMCTSCKNKMQLEATEADYSSNLQLVPVDGSEPADKLKKQVPKAVEKVLAGAIRRKMALEDFCAKQTSEIVKLNCLMQQYKHERECNAIIAQTREDKILRLENLIDGFLPTEEFLQEELVSLTQEHKVETCSQSSL
ncbi:hypothetical protein I3843_02G049200 [Carya illinoinensis]|uniref:Kinesin-like protein n=1 Tax=Carya illinoinensis TaxID=32201 RepID=A0A922K401_CARIL|nr:hypothetical protein I3760_02G061400 [Carya illinoinensis]KAG6726052.1 hypothetical protein I3842_02G061300 [Carya illinoinensis]KAG7990929.1 hypothetical protein I3843_02G049200 [Carya illinoinensis]